MAAKMGLVLDCADPAALADFWSAALGYTTLGGAGSYVLLVDEDGTQPKLLLQGVPDEKAAKNRMHIDIELLYFDDCPNWRLSDERLTTVASERDLPVVHRRVTTDEEASAAGFR